MVGTLPRWTQSIKFRLALTYAATVYAVGSLLVGGMYAWQVRQLDEPHLVAGQVVVRDTRTGQVFELNYLAKDAAQTYALEVFEQNAYLVAIGNLRKASLVGLLILVAVAFITGWMLANVSLRPINKMTAVARDISGSDLSRRISLQGPDDELRRLADTFDAMLDRLQTTFEDQRRFVQDASHELRNPLAVARTNLELALSDPDADTATLRRSAEIAHRSTGRMSHLVEDLLVQARSGVPNIEQVDVDLAVVAEDVRQQFLRPASERSIDLTIESEGYALVRGDEQALGRVVTNLVSNALRFAPPHSAVSTVIRTVEGHAELTVTDKGPGLTPEDQAQVFTRFWRGKNAGPGSGLGLSIVKQVMERHAGTVSVTSEPGQGSTFTVRLPLSPAAASGTAASPKDQQDPGSTATGRIRSRFVGRNGPKPATSADASMTAESADIATLENTQGDDG